MFRDRRVLAPALLVSLTLGVTAGLTACDGPRAGAGEGTPSTSSSSAEAELAGMPGMSAASIRRQGVEEDVEVTQVVVDADADASADQVAAVVEEVLGNEQDYADGDASVSGVVYLGAGATEWIDPDAPASADALHSGLWWGSDQGAPADEARPVAERAGWLVDAAALVPDAVVVVDHDDDLKVRLLDFDPAAVERAATTLLESDLAAVPTLVSAGDWVREVDHGPVAVLAGDPVDPDLVAAWHDFSSAADRAPELDVRELSLGPLFNGELDQTLGAGAVSAVTTIRLPGEVAPEALVPEHYAARVWPLLRPQLDVIRRLGPGASLTAVNLVGGPGGEVAGIDVFLTAGPGATSEPDLPGRGWTASAAKLLARG